MEGAGTVTSGDKAFFIRSAELMFQASAVISWATPFSSLLLAMAEGELVTSMGRFGASLYSSSMSQGFSGSAGAASTSPSVGPAVAPGCHEHQHRHALACKPETYFRHRINLLLKIIFVIAFKDPIAKEKTLNIAMLQANGPIIQCRTYTEMLDIHTSVSVARRVLRNLYLAINTDNLKGLEGCLQPPPWPQHAASNKGSGNPIPVVKHSFTQ